MTTPETPDPTMEAIGRAVGLGHEGDVESARRDLLAIWRRSGVAGDPLHRCTLAHYLADLYDDPAESLVWDLRALDAADAVTEERAQQHDAGLHVAGFYPSLHLNIADDLRRLGAFQAAAEHIGDAEQHSGELAADGYGDMIRTAIDEVRRAIAHGDTARRAVMDAPGSR